MFMPDGLLQRNVSFSFRETKKCSRYMSFHTSKIWQILNEEHFIKHKPMETSNKVVCECISGHNIS